MRVPSRVLRVPRMKRVVVVDDEPSVGIAVRDVLSAEGYEVDAPIDAQTALPEVLRSAPDLVILDVNMPRMNGITVLDIMRSPEVREMGAPIPVFLLTAHAEDGRLAEQSPELSAPEMVMP